MVTITISGTPGSGKSTVAKILEEKLGLNYIYSGFIFRELAKEHKMNLEEFGKYCEDNKNIDEQLDKRQVEILRKGNVIIEGRLAGWLAYKNKIKALKISIDADLKIRVVRIINRENGNIKDKKKELIKRERSEAKRYKRYYNIDIQDKSIYDLVIDSSDKTPEEIVDIILEKLVK